jgi:hypothetical protein
MTNPYVTSQGYVNLWNQDERIWEYIDVQGWPASAATGWLRVFQNSYQDSYGFYNVNNANLGRALDQALLSGYRPGGSLDGLLLQADLATPGAGARIFNQAGGEQLALGRQAIISAAARPFMDRVRAQYLNLPPAPEARQRAGGQYIQLAQAYLNSDAGMNLYPAHNPWRMQFTPLGGWGQHSGKDGIQGYDMRPACLRPCLD